ncbi:hypothetical protein CERSUDRAFT_71607 [Gelatoporia subvermispora B]|uniref:Uncharacterized protein n=1 Tax=Ceriporiopsis subvermispora (strain B) TaxID=914234 RepID=M2QRM1_CERS8|nr:hypothetical protein CERSUDRAFT_71607 [Gelatoporia subvermispora B]
MAPGEHSAYPAKGKKWLDQYVKQARDLVKKPMGATETHEQHPVKELNRAKQTNLASVTWTPELRWDVVRLAGFLLRIKETQYHDINRNSEVGEACLVRCWMTIGHLTDLKKGPLLLTQECVSSATKLADTAEFLKQIDALQLFTGMCAYTE